MSDHAKDVLGLPNITGATDEEFLIVCLGVSDVLVAIGFDDGFELVPIGWAHVFLLDAASMHGYTAVSKLDCLLKDLVESVE